MKLFYNSNEKSYHQITDDGRIFFIVLNENVVSKLIGKGKYFTFQGILLKSIPNKLKSIVFANNKHV
jgi:hypothetical protein